MEGKSIHIGRLFLPKKTHGLTVHENEYIESRDTYINRCVVVKIKRILPIFKFTAT